jgi:tryptophan halogenase
MINKVIVLGSGSAGLISALTLKRKLPQLEVRIVRDPDIPVIGVGEGTTPNIPRHLFEYLGIKQKRFYELAEPTWKLGIRFLWGTRGGFNYTFAPQLDAHVRGLRMANGFYCGDKFENVDLPGALMNEGKAFERQSSRGPDIHPWHAFHIENHKLVNALEEVAVESGVLFTDGKMVRAERAEHGVKAIHLADGQRLEADLFVDCSGFSSELLGGVMEEPFESFGQTLFCDRAVVGGWERSDEPILPYTTAETMDSGWAWQIEHEHFINRGYVYASDMISDDEAAGEFKRKNPKTPDSPRVVKFKSGCHRNMWAGNVVAIGNAGGFVEPLEATALMVVCSHAKILTEFLQNSLLDPGKTYRDLYNRITGDTWREIRDFLGLHYWANRADDTPFWQRCREETDLSGIQGLLDFYKENGPSRYLSHQLPNSLSDFGIEGYLVMLIGNQVPYDKSYEIERNEDKTWNHWCAALGSRAKRGIGVKEALEHVRHRNWKWETAAGRR